MEIDRAHKSLITETDSCSLLWIFFSAQNSFMFSAPVFFANSLTALPPTTASQTRPAHRSPPQLHYSIPVPPHHPLLSCTLQVHGMLWASWGAKRAQGEREQHDNRLSSLQSPMAPFSSLLRPVITSSLCLPNLCGSDSCHGGGRFHPAVSVFPMSRLNPQIWAPRIFPQQLQFGVVLYSHKPNSIWESCSALASELERKQACKGLLGYSPPPTGGHETSLMGASPGNPALPCLGDQFPNLSPPLSGTSSLLRGRDIQHTLLQESYTQVSMQPRQQVCPAGTPVKEHTTAVDALPSCTPDFRAWQSAEAQPWHDARTEFVAGSVPYLASASESRLWLSPTCCYLK